MQQPDSSDPGRQITLLLRRYAAGDDGAFDELCQQIYPQLKQLARSKRSSLPAASTPGATTIVHEAYLKLAGSAARDWNDERHFLAVAATAMRQIILDHLRGMATRKRGHERDDSTLDQFAAQMEWTPDVVASFEQGLERLRSEQPMAFRVFECKYFAGYSSSETAEVLGTPLRSVERHWTDSRRFLADYVARP